MTYNPNAEPPPADDEPQCKHCDDEWGCIACFSTGRTGMDGDACPECEGSGACPWCGRACALDIECTEPEGKGDQ